MFCYIQKDTECRLWTRHRPVLKIEIMDDVEQLRSIIDIKVTTMWIYAALRNQSRPLCLSSFFYVRKYLSRSLHNSSPPNRTFIIPCLSYHSWKLAGSGIDTRELVFSVFSPMPSVHRMDYSCLQLKSRLSWPEVRREVSASCLTVETLPHLCKTGM